MTTPGDAYRGLPLTPATAALRDRHLEFFRTLARRAHDGEYGLERDLWAGVLESEIDNVRAALVWALETRQARAAMDLAASCLRLWIDGRWTEGRTWVDRVLALDGTATAERVRSLGLAADLARYGDRHRIVAENVALARQVADPRLSAEALNRLGGDY